MLVDYHTHTELTDGVGKPRDYAAVALQRGLKELGCSDHAPLGDRDIEWTMKLKDLDTYVWWVREAQAEFPELSIKLGLEVDFFPGREDWIRELAAMYEWDFFLGSVHFIGEWPVDESKKYWQGRDVDQTWREYFEVWAAAARAKLFDSMAHPDLPKKFGHHPASDFTTVFEKALQAVKQADVAIEVSTAGLRKPCREIYPSRDFLQIAYRLGIPITLGSDAHLPEEVGQDVDQAVALAHSAGYREICRFEKRQRFTVSL